MQLETNHRGNQHREWLAKHGSLRFDSAHAPAHHAETIHHGGVRIGAHQRIGKGEALAILFGAEHDTRQVLEIHLVANSSIRRHDLEILQSLLAPAKEGVALDVALHFEIGVEGEGVRGAEFVHLHRVIDYQFGGQQRIDFLRVAPELRIASRMAARSTTAGTPVKSCSSTRAGMKETSFSCARSTDPRTPGREYRRSARSGRPHGAVDFREGLSEKRASGRRYRFWLCPGHRG